MRYAAQEVVPEQAAQDHGAAGQLPVVVDMHGGGWILGDAATHDRLVRARTAVAVAGESLGRNMTAALALMAEERGDAPAPGRD